MAHAAQSSRAHQGSTIAVSGARYGNPRSGEPHLPAWLRREADKSFAAEAPYLRAVHRRVSTPNEALVMAVDAQAARSIAEAAYLRGPWQSTGT